MPLGTIKSTVCTHVSTEQPLNLLCLQLAHLQTSKSALFKRETLQPLMWWGSGYIFTASAKLNVWLTSDGRSM